MNNYEYDALKEVISIGAGNSSTALSTLINQPVKIDIPQIKLLSVEDVVKEMGDKEEVVTVILVQLKQNIKGAILFIFDDKTIYNIAALLTNDSEMNMSALKEMINIMLGSGLTAVAQFLEFTILHTVSAEAHDMLGAVTDPIIANLGARTEHVLLVGIQYSINTCAFKSYFLTDPNSTKLIMEKLQKKFSNNSNNGIST